MATALVNLSGFTRGLAAAEVGINIESIDIDAAPEYKDYITGYNGDVLGFAHGPIKSEITISGEYTASSGIFLVSAATAFVQANAARENIFRQTAGGLYAESMTSSESRDGFRKITVKFSRHAGIT